MDGISDIDRRIVREIIVGHFELFETQGFTRDAVYHVVMTDRDMPKVAGKLGYVIQEFDRLLAQGAIVDAGGAGPKQLFRLRKARD